MSNAVEDAKKIVGRPYTTTSAKDLQGMVPGQEIEILSRGYVRKVGGKSTYVVVDSDENVIAVLVGDGQ